MTKTIVAALVLGLAWAAPARAQLPTTQLPTAADAKQQAADAKASGAAKAEAAKAQGAVRVEAAKAEGTAKAGEKKATMKASAAKKAREVKGKAKTKADAKVEKAGLLQPAAAGAVQNADSKAEQKIEAVTK